jgi:hypothetical protein
MPAPATPPAPTASTTPTAPSPKIRRLVVFTGTL